MAENLMLHCKTTPGVGDFMFALNRAFMMGHNIGMKFPVTFHWKHGTDHLHHFEDPETIIERFEYLLPMYRDYQLWDIQHTFNSYHSDDLERKRFIVSDDLRQHTKSSMAKVEKMWQEWSFNDYFNKETKKVVIWRTLFNAETPRAWKRLVTNDEWDNAIDILQSLGYHVEELSYRTPVREAHYHIKTCEFVVCYDGMWHYIAKNYWKPMIVASRSGITKVHTPHALMLNEGIDKGTVEKFGVPKWHSKHDNRDFLTQLKKLHTPCPEYGGKTTKEFISDKALRYKKIFEDWYNSCK